MEKQSKTGLSRLIDATRYSLQGLTQAWRSETAFRQELVVIVLATPAAFWLGITATQRALLVCSALLILIVELINSAIEATVDRIGAERHPLSGQAKNMGSAAVLIALIGAVAVWGLVAWERWQSF
jgi:diacylglycerol kinase (ATP)